MTRVTLGQLVGQLTRRLPLVGRGAPEAREGALDDVPADTVPPGAAPAPDGHTSGTGAPREADVTSPASGAPDTAP